MTLRRIEVPIYGMQTFEVDADDRDTAIALILAGEVDPVSDVSFDIELDTNNWVFHDAYPPVTICEGELKFEGYTEFVSQDGEGEVVLRNKDGRLEFFAIRDSYSGWCIKTTDGRVLEFVRSESNDDWLKRIRHDT